MTRNSGKTNRTLWMAAAVLPLLASSAFGQFAATGTSTLSVTVAAEAAIQVNTATTTLTNGGSTIFGANYTGTTSLTFKLRSTKTTGTASITVQNTEFAGNGPKIASTELTFTCTAASGTACAGSQNASTSAAVSVVTFAASGTGSHSANAGDAATVAWTITDKPSYETGTFTSTATFTIATT